LEKVLEANRELFAGDLWLMCDGPVYQTRDQQIVFGSRGDTGLDVTLYGPRVELHSGHYGNWALNPAMMLAQLLERNAHHTLLLSPTSVTAEVLSKLAEERRTVICISALPPFAFTATRSLCQQIRNYLPHNRIVIGMWNSEATGKKSVEQFGAGKPDAVLNTLAEVLVKVEEWDAGHSPQLAALTYPKRVTKEGIPPDMPSYPDMPLSPDSPNLVTGSE